MDNLVRRLGPIRFLFFGSSLSLTLSSSCAHHSSAEFLHATGVFKHKILRKSLSVVWCESVMRVLSWLRSSIWSFAAPQEKEISSRTTLQSFSQVEIDTLCKKGVADWFRMNRRTRRWNFWVDWCFWNRKKCFNLDNDNRAWFVCSEL